MTIMKVQSKTQKLTPNGLLNIRMRMVGCNWWVGAGGMKVEWRACEQDGGWIAS